MDGLNKYAKQEHYHHGCDTLTCLLQGLNISINLIKLQITMILCMQKIFLFI